MYILQYYSDNSGATLGYLIIGFVITVLVLYFIINAALLKLTRSQRILTNLYIAKLKKEGWTDAEVQAVIDMVVKS